MHTVADFPPSSLQDATETVRLSLITADPDVCAELRRYSDDDARNDYALGALKIGVIAIRHAQGQIDGERIKAEGERILLGLNHALGEHRRTVAETLNRALGDYFDPNSGRFTERVERLVGKDGDLETVLRQLIGPNDSVLARTLAESLGHDSPLQTLMDPHADGGFIEVLTGMVERALAHERETILAEFSLDKPESALTRLIGELTKRHGEVRVAMEQKLDEVVGEFSLDNDQSALSRLVSRVENTQKRISSEFSLDDQDSALARMRREMLALLSEHRAASSEFQQKVLEQLATLAERRRQVVRSIHQGLEFQEAVLEMVQHCGTPAGDLVTWVGDQVGLTPRSKVGDVLVELGADHAASGARIVVEAKAEKGVSLVAALEELESARKNRDAGVGVMVFTPDCLPAAVDGLLRHVNDIITSWDAADPSTDVRIAAALSLAKALSVRAKVTGEEVKADLAGVDRAIRAVEKQAESIDDIVKWARTVKNDGQKIETRALAMSDELLRQVAELDSQLERLKGTLAVDPPA